MRGKHPCQQPIHIPCCPEKSNGSHSNILERLIQNVLSVQWGGKKQAVKCRPLPQVLQRSRETGLKINRPPSTWSWGMKVRTCLLAPDADLIKKKKQKNKPTNKPPHTSAKQEQLVEIKTTYVCWMRGQLAEDWRERRAERGEKKYQLQLHRRKFPLSVLICCRVKAVSSEVRREAPFPQGSINTILVRAH